MAACVDGNGDAGIGRAEHRTTRLDGSEHRTGKVLRDSASRAEPRIIGQVHQNLRAVSDEVSGKLRKQNLIADERPDTDLAPARRPTAIDWPKYSRVSRDCASGRRRQVAPDPGGLP